MERAMIGLGLAVAVAVAVAVSAVPVLAQNAEDPSPSAEATEIPLTTKSGRPDLYLDMPYNIGGFEPEIAMLRGEEHFASLASDDPTRIELEMLLESIDAETEDLVSGYALVSQDDFFAFVVSMVWSPARSCRPTCPASSTTSRTRRSTPTRWAAGTLPW